MPTWIASGNGTWTDPANWSGGVPSAAGSTANFSFATNAGGTVIIGIPEFADIRVGIMNINMTGTTGITIRGSLTDSGADIGDLIFSNGGSAAQLNITTLSTTSPTTFSSAAGLRMALESNLAVNVATVGSIARFDLPVSGSGTLILSGAGTLELNSANSFTGGIDVTGGILDAFADSALGTGAVTISNSATFRSAGTVNNTIGTVSNITGTAGSAQIVAAAATTLTLTGTLAHISQGTVNFGSATDTGTIIASFGSILENATNSAFRIAGGTLRMGNAFNATNLLNHPGAGLTEIQNGGILDTGGFATTISNLDFDDGTIRSSVGTLNVTVNDVFVANNAQNGTLEGTAGADTFTINASFGFNLSGMTFVNWTAGVDTITIIGSAGNNSITGSTQRDIILGGDGNDSLTGGDGNDILAGGIGDDILNGGTGGNQYIGGAGNDIFIVAADTTANMVLNSLVESVGEGVDEVQTTASVFALDWFGGNEIELLTVTDNGNHAALIGNGFNNIITGGTGVDDLFGRDGNDTLVGGSGSANSLFGGLGDDIFVVSAVGDSVVEFSGQGSDSVQAAVASFTLRDNVENLIFTGANTARIGVGNEQSNLIIGLGAADSLSGAGGDDVIIGGSGADILQGGSGADQFRFEGGESGMDRILDFQSGTDKLALRTAGFTPNGAVNFVSGPGAVANTAASTILYDTNTGIVWYDDDGAGGVAAIQIAQLNFGQAFTANDFLFY